MLSSTKKKATNFSLRNWLSNNVLISWKIHLYIWRTLSFTIVYIYKEKTTPYLGELPSDNKDAIVRHPDCNVDLCANDLDRLVAIKTKNDVSQDSVLSEFFIAIY